MNAQMVAQKTSTIGDLLTVRCDSSGRLLLGSGGGGTAGFYNVLALTNAYIADDSVGGEQEIPLAPEASVVFRLDTLSLVDPAAQSANLLVMLFAAAKASHLGTITDNAPIVWTANMRAAYAGGIEVQAADWKTVAGSQVVTLSNLGIMARTDAAGSLWMAFAVLSGTPNFGTNPFYYKPGFLRL